MCIYFYLSSNLIIHSLLFGRPHGIGEFNFIVKIQCLIFNGDYTFQKYSSTQLLISLEAKIIEMLSNCSSDVSEFNLRDEMFEYKERTIIFGADLLGAANMSGIDLRECLLEKISPTVLVPNVSLKVVCTANCTVFNACSVMVTTSLPITSLPMTSLPTTSLPQKTNPQIPSISTTDKAKGIVNCAVYSCVFSLLIIKSTLSN